MMYIFELTKLRARFWRRATLPLATTAVGLLLFTHTPVVQAQAGLERLFTTPALRAELDRRRLRSLQPDSMRTEPVAPAPVQIPVVPDDAPEPDTIYQFGGSMRRSDGSYTVWINDAAYAGNDLPDNMELVQPYSQGQVRVRDPDTGAQYLVKPGQVLNLSTGELMESYEYRPTPLLPSATTVTTPTAVPVTGQSPIPGAVPVQQQTPVAPPPSSGQAQENLQ